MINLGLVYKELTKLVSPKINVREKIILTSSKDLQDALRIDIEGCESYIDGLGKGYTPDQFARAIINKIKQVSESYMHYIYSDNTEFNWAPKIDYIYEKCEVLFDAKNRAAVIKLTYFDKNVRDMMYQYNKGKGYWNNTYNGKKAHQVLLGNVVNTATSKKAQPPATKIDYKFSNVNTPSIREDGVVLVPSHHYNESPGLPSDFLFMFSEILEHTNDNLVVRVHRHSLVDTFNKTYSYRIKANKVSRIATIEVNQVEPLTHAINFECNPYNDHYSFFPEPKFKTDLVFITRSNKVFIKILEVWILLPEGLKSNWEQMGAIGQIKAEIDLHANISKI